MLGSGILQCIRQGPVPKTRGNNSGNNENCNDNSVSITSQSEKQNQLQGFQVGRDLMQKIG